MEIGLHWSEQQEVERAIIRKLGKLGPTPDWRLHYKLLYKSRITRSIPRLERKLSKSILDEILWELYDRNLIRYRLQGTSVKYWLRD